MYEVPQFNEASAHVGELAGAAAVHIAKEEFVDGFKLLALSQEKAKLDNNELAPDEAVNLGYALAAAGHVFYNYCVDTEGYVFEPYWPVRGLEGQGEIKFQQAAEVFKRAVESDPSNVRAYFGLSEMQWELGRHQDSAQTVERLEAVLEEGSVESTPVTLLVLARQHERLEDNESASRSYARAIEDGAGLSPLLHRKVAREVIEYVERRDLHDAKMSDNELQRLISSCRRAIILDPHNRYTQAMLSHFEQREINQKLAA